MNRRPGLALALALALAFALSACGNFSDRSAAGKTNEFVWLTRYDVKTLDPAAVQDWTTGTVLSYLYPSIGKLCDIANDKPNVYSLTVKPTIFTDGTPVTAEDIRFTLERCLSTEVHSSVGNQFASQIRGSKDIADGKAPHLAGITIQNVTHLSIILDQADSAFIEKLKNNAFGVLNHKIVPLHKPIDDAKPGYGAGNWTMASISPGTEWSLTQKTTGEKLKFRFSGDSANRRNLYDTKAGDYAMFAAHEIGVVKGHKDLTKGGPTTLVYLQINPKTKPELTMPQRNLMREAVKEINFAALLGSHVQPANDFLALSGVTASPLQSYVQDIVIPLPRQEITFAEIGMQNPSVEAIVAALNKKEHYFRGFQGRAMPSGAMLEANAKGQIPILFTGWQPDFDGPLNTIPMLFHSKSSENHSGYNNPKVDALIDQAQRGINPAENIRKAHAIIWVDAPCIPLYIQRDLVLMRREPPKP